jgi:hypothetical protein
MLGQFLVEPDDVEPDELLEGVELVPLVPLVLLVPVELVLDVLVAALATSAPPVTRPTVSAPNATALRRRSFMVVCPF